MRRFAFLALLSIFLALPVQAQTNISAQSYKQGPTTTQSITSAAAGTGIDVTGYSTVAVMYKGTYTTNATTSGFDLSWDSGTTYVSAQFYKQSDCSILTDTGDLTDNSTNVWFIHTAGANRIRTSALNYASGTIAVTLVPFSSPATPCDIAISTTTSALDSNLKYVGGTATDTNSGSKSGGTLRIVLATDQPQLTNKLLVTPDANSAVNLAQLNGAANSATNPLVTVFPGTIVSGTITSAMTGTTSTSLVSGTASNYLYICSCALSNDHASVSTTMILQDGSGGTTLWKGLVPFGGGSNITFPTPLKVPTAGNALYIANVTTGSSTYASCSGFRSTVSY